jgi:hypothetical protein
MAIIAFQAGAGVVKILIYVVTELAKDRACGWTWNHILDPAWAWVVIRYRYLLDRSR